MIISLFRKAPTSIPPAARAALSIHDAARVQDVRRTAGLDLTRQGVSDDGRLVVEMVVDELVANALQHQGCEALCVTTLVSSASVRVTVTGDTPVPPSLWEARRASATAEDGRGLLLVTALTARRGVTATGLWCVVPLTGEQLEGAA
ncbi:ATP-binding protein [Streptomyces virginiae]|uniref:ATP-binding protein n=1 Tax=Streptomyces virginiae TaxID=1961 RepID=UPI0036FEDBAE